MGMKCVDCYWFSDVTVKCCEIDGSDPCDPESDACSRFQPKENLEHGSHALNNNMRPGCLMTDQEKILRCVWNIEWLEQEKVKLYQEYVDKIAAINRDIEWLQKRISNQLFN